MLLAAAVVPGAATAASAEDVVVSVEAAAGPWKQDVNAKKMP